MVKKFEAMQSASDVCAGGRPDMSFEGLRRTFREHLFYLSAEFLLGPHLENNLINLGIYDREIRDGWQVDQTDQWLRLGNPWEMTRPEITYHVGFGGRTEPYEDDPGRYRVRWAHHRTVKGVAYDTPIPGYRVNKCNLLRLWKAEAAESFEFEAFNVGDFYGAVDQKIYSENITKVLLFGLTAEEVSSLQKDGYQRMEYYRSNAELQGVMDLISSGHFSHGDPELFKPLVDSLLLHDPFMLPADFGAYVEARKQVDEAYRDQERWTRMSILNVARMGKFFSDRAIREYCRDIWKAKPAPVTLD